MQLFLTSALIFNIALCYCLVGQLMIKKRYEDSLYFFLLCVAVMLYSTGYLLEINSNREASMFASMAIKTMGTAALGPFFLLLILQQSYEYTIKPWMISFALGHIFVMFLGALTNENHNLYYTGVRVIEEPWVHLALRRGPIAIYNQMLNYVSVLYSYWIIYRCYVVWPQRVRRHMFYIVIGSIVILLCVAISMTRIFHMIDLTPFACGFTLTCYLVSLFSADIHELVHIASRQATQSMDDAMVVLDKDGGYLYANDSAVRLFPQLRTFAITAPASLMERWPKELKGVLAPGMVSFDLEVAGSLRNFKCNISHVGKPEEINGWSILMRDVTEYTLLLKQLEELAITDPLTGIINRRHFFELSKRTLVSAARQKCEFGLILFDLDFFKKVNDTYGHSAGDMVLVAVAETVKHAVRTSDIFSRYGGEEFIVLCPFSGQNEALHLAERLRQAIGEIAVEFEGHIISIKASFGVTVLTPSDSLELAIVAADKAMYNAKSSGRNCVRFEQLNDQETAG